MGSGKKGATEWRLIHKKFNSKAVSQQRLNAFDVHLDFVLIVQGSTSSLEGHELFYLDRRYHLLNIQFEFRIFPFRCR